MNLRRMLGLLLVATLFVLSGCATLYQPDWYTVTGSGVGDDALNPGQARLMAKRAARLDAQRQILEAAKGVAISSTTTVENFMTRDDYIRSRVAGIIRDAKIMNVRYNDDGTCEVDMRIDMNQIRNLIR